MEMPMKSKAGIHLPFAVCALLLAAVSAQAGEPADARFKGTGKADPIRISNVTCAQAAAKGSGTITLDMAWDNSWRAAWDVDAAQHGGKDKMSVENWDAAWVFVKFRTPGAEGWRHATLSANAADHTVPAGAKIDIGPSDDGQRALGVFVYRSSPGSGPNDWKAITLRWLYGVDGVAHVDQVLVAGSRAPAAKKAPVKKAAEADPLALPEDDSLGKALDQEERQADKKKKGDKIEIRICALQMVYVPQGAFWVGDGTTNSVAGQFSAGGTTEPFRIESEHGVVLGGPDKESLGNRNRFNCADDFSGAKMRWLPPRFPKGFDAFYCMKHEITEGQMVDFLNTTPNPADFGALIGAGKNGLAIAFAGPPVEYKTDTPYQPCSGLEWSEGTAYAAWAGLRPMTELEFEKACRGPLKPVSDEYAWGTAAIAGSNSKEGPRDGYALRNAGMPDETVVWEGANGPDATRGNAAWIGNIVGQEYGQWGSGYAVSDISRPLRVGIFLTPDSGRVAAGASYWGITELSGNLCEYAVTVGNTMGRRFAGVHGDGSLAQPAGWYALQKALRVRGGGINAKGAMLKPYLRVSDRQRPGLEKVPRNPLSFVGFRAVRSAVLPPVPPAGPGIKPPPGADDEDAAFLFNTKLRIENVSLKPRDEKSALLRFDIAWEDSWRNATNHDAVWVFFKAQPAGGTNWQHVNLVASKVLNPTGFGQESGTRLEFVVPDGKDGFAGVFLQRAEPGAGPVSAQGVTVVCSAQAQAPDVRAFGIEMVYVPEGPFFLGSGGTEQARFYQYTDGSQNTLPYRVADAGPIPTGPQPGRLWATAYQPDGGDAGEIPAAFPNGYQAFYCMKHCVKQGQFAGFLGMQSVVKSDVLSFRNGNWPVLYRHVSGGSSLTWGMGAAFGAWAGLRPMTELEYEKACRGLREPVPDEAGPSVWGIRNLNVGEMTIFTVSVADPGGRSFKGTHGSGAPIPPADWRGGARRGAQLSAGAEGNPFDRVRISFRDSRPGDANEGESTGVEGSFRGWRGVRTAPNLKPDPTAGEKKPAGNFKLELDPLPALGDADIAVFYLAGRFHNGGDQPVQAEVTPALPDACFPDGAASRAFTAAPKAATPFKVLTLITRQTAQTARRVQALPVRIKKAGGDVLAETTASLALGDPMAVKPSVLGNLTGGTLALRLLNITNKPAVFTIELQPPAGIALAESARKVELGVGNSPVEAQFAATLSDASLTEGFYPIPYRLTMADGAAQTGQVIVEIRAQSRWWVQQDAANSVAAMQPGDEPAMGGIDGLDLGETGLVAPQEKPGEKVWNADPAGVFKAEVAPKGWQAVTNGASLWLRQLKPVPQPKSILSAATRVFVNADQDAILKMAFETDCWTTLDGHVLASIDSGLGPGLHPPPTKVWINGDLVRDTRTAGKTVNKAFSLKKGGNTMLTRFEAAPDARGQFPQVFPLFDDAKTGARIENLVLDMEKKP